MTDKIWAAAAYAAVHKVAEGMSEFTPDDIWETGLQKPLDARALGSVMRKANREKLIEKTGRVQPTRQTESHGTDITIWRSLIFQGK